MAMTSHSNVRAFKQNPLYPSLTKGSTPEILRVIPRAVPPLLVKMCQKVNKPILAPSPQPLHILGPESCVR